MKLMVTNGLLRRTSRKTGASASRSWVSAGVIWHSIGRPSVSTATWRLRPLIFLGGIEAARPASLRRLDRLAVDHDHSRGGIAALRLTCAHHEDAHDLGP